MSDEKLAKFKDYLEKLSKDETKEILYSDTDSATIKDKRTGGIVVVSFLETINKDGNDAIDVVMTTKSHIDETKRNEPAILWFKCKNCGSVISYDPNSSSILVLNAMVKLRCKVCRMENILEPYDIDSNDASAYNIFDYCYTCGQPTKVCSGTGCCEICDTVIEADGHRYSCRDWSKTVEKLKFRVKLGHDNTYWLFILNGVTGYESIKIDTNLRECIDKRDYWSACGGTEGRWDKLEVPYESLKEIWNTLLRLKVVKLKIKKVTDNE